jgi:outer membrane protein TolC
MKRYRSEISLFWVVYGVLAVGGTGCRGPEQYVTQADEEVYGIIESKWDDSFGEMVNHSISESGASPNDIRLDAVDLVGVVGLSQAAARATSHNREYHRQKERLYLSVLDLTLVRHSYKRQWFGTIDGAYTRNDGEEQLDADGRLGFDQLLADGAQVSAAIALDWARFLGGDPSTSLGSVLSSSVTQPLLRGRGRKIAQERLTQTERNALYQIRSFNRYRKSFIVDIVSDYYRVLQQADKVTNALNNYLALQELTKRLEIEADHGRTARFQVDQAKQNELNARDGHIRAQQNYEQELDLFKIRLSLSPEADIRLDPNELAALREVEISQPSYTVQAAMQTALERRLDLANLADAIEDAERNVAVAADGLGMELNLQGGINVSSKEVTDFTTLQFHQGRYSLGLEADLPLDRKAERNAYRRALIAWDQRRRDYENTVDIIRLAARQAFRNLEEEAESYRTQTRSRELARQRVMALSLLREAGRATTRDLLESQDALLLAENSLTRALVNHTIAKLGFFRDIGVLHVRPDGMWKGQVL